MAKTRRFKVAVVGATGAVGTEMLRVLEERRFPISFIRLLASERSAGKRLSFNGTSYRVKRLTKRSFEGVDLALFSAGASRALEFAPEAVRRGAIVVDNSSAFRLQDGVPLVVPEVNPHAIESHQGLVANPNCSAIIMLVALKPLHDAARITRIIVSTYQSVSGAGAKAMAQLYEETKRSLRQFRVASSEFSVQPKLSTRNSQLPTPLPAQIAFNLIPQVDAFLDNRYTKEEMKLVHETRKILEEPHLAISATCIRVPVFVGHSEAIWIETERPLAADEARRILQQAPGVRVVDDLPAPPPASQHPGRAGSGASAPAIVRGGPGRRAGVRRPRYPMPLEAAGRDEVLVGRIRADESIKHGLAMWVSGDNLRKGAATNAIQIAELIFRGVR